jgi:hypothetical protein
MLHSGALLLEGAHAPQKLLKLNEGLQEEERRKQKDEQKRRQEQQEEEEKKSPSIQEHIAPAKKNLHPMMESLHPPFCIKPLRAIIAQASKSPKKHEALAAMSYYWALVENIPVKRLKALQSAEVKYGLFYDEGLSSHLNTACVDWKDLLTAMMEVDVEPNRLDIQAALHRVLLLLDLRVIFLIFARLYKTTLNLQPYVDGRP